MKRIVILCFAVVSYTIGLASIVYYAGFLAEIAVPKAINAGNPGSAGLALAVNVLLLVLFGLQHSVMARQGFKSWVKQWISSAAVRSLYILMSSVAVALICWLWRPMPYELYDLRSTIWGNTLTVLYFAGWAVGLFSTFLIDHFDLFGLKQAWYNWSGRTDFRYRFRTPLLYRIVRHPIYFGWLMIHWFTPHMTVGHLLFASLITVYIYVAIYYEERDLLNQFGKTYSQYQESTPKLIPLVGQKLRTR